MTAPVQIVLQETIDALGKAGDIVKVRPGYARNYLLPRGMAVFATHGSLKKIEHDQQAALAKEAKNRKLAEGIAASLEAIELRIEKSAGDAGRLFGSVTASEIATELGAKGYEVDRRKITMPEEAIKEVGEYTLPIKLGHGVSTSLKLVVEASQ